MTPEATDSAIHPPTALTHAGAAAARCRHVPAAETLRLYEVDWRGFVAWCVDAEQAALPADPATVACFLRAGAEKLSVGALARRAAAIGEKHRALGLASPTADPAVKAILREARRGARVRRRPPAPDARQLARMAAACPGDLAGLRDRAVLLLAAAGFSRVALVGLDAEHIRLTPAGAEILIVDQGDDIAGSRRLTVARAATWDACPARALENWLRTSDTLFGPVFRKIDRWGNVEQHRLGTDAIRRILARRTPRRTRRAGRARPAGRTGPLGQTPRAEQPTGTHRHGTADA